MTKIKDNKCGKCGYKRIRIIKPKQEPKSFPGTRVTGDFGCWYINN